MRALEIALSTLKTANSMTRSHLVPVLVSCAVLASSSTSNLKVEAFVPTNARAPGVNQCNNNKVVSSSRTCKNGQILPAGHRSVSNAQPASARQDSPTQLNAIVDVPMGFFTTAGISLGIMNAIMRPYNRQIIEERAWQQRLEEARRERLEEDPTLTELDLIREEAENIVAPYGPDAMDRREEERERELRGRRRRVMVMDDDDDDEDDDYYDDDEYPYRRGRGRRRGRKSTYQPPPEDKYKPMTDDEIDDFEAEYGVEYDPYYDEPYEEDELPQDMKCYTDGMFMDKRYENGEVFYYDEDLDMYWRQGCKPRIKKMFGF